MARKIGFGLVGMGIHGMRYANHLLADVGGAELTAVCRTEAAKGRSWAAAHAVEFFPDYRDLVRAAVVDAVAIVAPPDVGAAACLAALQAGKPVLMEKPLAADLEMGSRLVEAAGQPGAVLMVGQTLRWNSVVRAMRHHAGRVGRLLMMALNQRFEPGGRPWLDVPGPGGVILNTGIHSFDLVRHLAGEEVVEVWCRTATVTTRRTPDTFAAALILESGGLVTVDNCRATQGRTGRIEMVGEKGQMMGDHVLGTLQEITASGRRDLALEAPAPTVQRALQDFTVCVENGGPVPVPAAEGLRALEVVMACRLSNQENRPVRIDELG